MSGPRERDPLSVRYDATAEKAVTRAIQAGGQWVEYDLKPPSQESALIIWRALGRWMWEVSESGYGRQHGEYAWMTAFRRACYYDDRIYLHDKTDGSGSGSERPVNPMRTHALKWGGWRGRRTLRGRRVTARMRVFSIQSASAYSAAEKPYYG